MSENANKDMQRIEVDMLLEVDRICKKFKIRYFLVAGTLLGAVRHKGFIPWDDDIDIAMPLKDYIRFCKIAEKELDKEYFLQNYKTDITAMWYTKIRKNNTTAIQINHKNRMHHQGIWIDIFPLIGVENNEKWLYKLNKKAKRTKKILTKKLGLMEDTEGKIVYKIANKLISLKICRMIFGIIFKHLFKDPESYSYCYYLWSSSKIKARFLTEFFYESCEVEFEGHMFPAPYKWDEYLTTEYGDYMTPPPPEKRNGGSHTISIVDINNDYTKYINR